MGTNTKRKNANKKQVVFVVFLLLAIVFGVYFYAQRSFDAALLKCKFTSAPGAASKQLRLEIASTPAERSKGLMYRKSMAEDHGMLFIFPEMHDASFWMKDTYLPLDIIFIDNNLKVVGVLADVPITNEKKRSVGAQSQYVVELPAGEAKKNGIAAGSVLSCEGVWPRGV